MIASQILLKVPPGSTGSSKLIIQSTRSQTPWGRGVALYLSAVAGYFLFRDGNSSLPSSAAKMPMCLNPGLDKVQWDRYVPEPKAAVHSWHREYIPRHGDNIPRHGITFSDMGTAFLVYPVLWRRCAYAHAVHCGAYTCGHAVHCGTKTCGHAVHCGTKICGHPVHCDKYTDGHPVHCDTQTYGHPVHCDKYTYGHPVHYSTVMETYIRCTVDIQCARASVFRGL